jgi:hypothetical protein
LIKTFSPWEPVADVLDDLAQSPPEEVMPAVAQAIAGAMENRVGVLLRIVLELMHGDPDTAQALQRSMTRGLPDLVSYLESQMQAGRLRPPWWVLPLRPRCCHPSIPGSPAASRSMWLRLRMPAPRRWLIARRGAWPIFCERP